MQTYINKDIREAAIKIYKQYTYRKESAERNMRSYISIGKEIYKNNAIRWTALAKQSKAELVRMMSLA